TGEVRDNDDAARAVLAAARGAHVVVMPPADPRTRAYVLDGLRRVAPVDAAASTAVERDTGVALEPDEREILRLLAAGHTINDIAEVVGYSRRTVQRRLDDIRRRLGVASNAEALMIAARDEPPAP